MADDRSVLAESREKRIEEAWRRYLEAWDVAFKTYSAPPHRIVFRAIKKQFSKKNRK